MKTIGILTVNDFSFHPNARLRAAARARGHRVRLINPYQTVAGLVRSGPALKSLRFDGLPDVILPRQGSPMGEYGLVLLRQIIRMGIPLVNGLDGVTIARHQFYTLQTLDAAGIRVPESCFVTTPEGFFRAVSQVGGYPVIAKQPSGMGGDGVELVADEAAAQRYLAEFLEPVKGVVVQRFIPPGGRQDIRILVVGGRTVGVMRLSPPAGDFRANVHQSGTARAFDPPGDWKTLAEQAADACRLEIAGVDLLVEKGGRPLVVEVNYSPGFRGLESATGLDIAGKIVDYAVSGSVKTKGGK